MPATPRARGVCLRFVAAQGHTARMICEAVSPTRAAGHPPPPRVSAVNLATDAPPGTAHDSMSERRRRGVAPSAAHPDGGRLLLVHRARHAELDAAIPAALYEQAGLVLTELPLEQQHPEARSANIRVWVGVPAA